MSEIAQLQPVAQCVRSEEGDRAMTRKPVTAWVVYKDHQRMHADENHGEVYYARNIARQAADELRADGFEVRGPVKVVLP